MKRTGFAILRKSNPTARASVPVFKPRKCAVCRDRFTPTKPMQKVCGWSCACQVAAKQRVKEILEKTKADRRETKAKLEKLKPIGYWESKAQDAINWYVKERDWFKGCASCDLPASWDGQWHASHFRSVGAASAVRYHLWNIHKACVGCNHFKSGNLTEYEPRLRVDIGNEKVDWLRTQNQIVKYQREYLQRVQRVFNKKARRQEKRNAVLCE